MNGEDSDDTKRSELNYLSMLLRLYSCRISQSAFRKKWYVIICKTEYINNFISDNFGVRYGNMINIQWKGIVSYRTQHYIIGSYHSLLLHFVQSAEQTSHLDYVTAAMQLATALQLLQ
jgi:hypothetical protein